METKKAYICWIHPMHQEKKLPLGIRYCPHMVCSNDTQQEHWSVCFIITKDNQAHEGMIDFSMLIHNDETKTFFETLTPNTKFVLLEGSTKVAYGYIL